MDQIVGQQETYWGLAKLDYARRWLDGFAAIFENFLVSASSILLMIGIGVAMFDFFSGGSAFQTAWLRNTWAVIQTLAVDSQFLLMWYRCKLSLKNRRIWSALGYAVLGLMLAFVTFGTNAIPSLQLARNSTFNDAIQELGFDVTSIVYVRTLVLVILAVLAAFNREVIVFNGESRIQVSSATGEKKVKVKKEKPVKKVKQKFNWFGWFSNKKVDAPIVQPVPSGEKKIEIVMTENQIQEVEKSKVGSEKISDPQQTFSQDDNAVSLKKEAISKQDTGGNLEVAEVKAAIAAATMPTPPETPLNAPDEQVERPEQLERSEVNTGELAKVDEEDKKDGSNGTASSFSNNVQSRSSGVQAPHRPLIGLPLEEVYEHPKIVGQYNRSNSRRKAVDAALKAGILKVKSDGSITENAINAWLKAAQPVKEI